MYSTLKRLVVCTAGFASPALAQTVLFDFDSAPIHTPLPLDVSVSGITAHLSASGQGFSIQRADTMGFTPAGFAGLCIYPSSVFPADLFIGFSQSVRQFSIMYSPQELGCDDSARMRVSAYLNGGYVGTSTSIAPFPGTWPTGTLTFDSAQPFNSVTIHYDARPPTCQDWGPIFLADNMTVTLAAVCYPNCDGSTTPPILNVLDFSCFLNRFAALDPWANCDGSTTPPVLNVQDFSCFLNTFAAGCP